MRSTDGVRRHTTHTVVNLQLNGSYDSVVGTHVLPVGPRGCSHAEAGLWHMFLPCMPPLLPRGKTTYGLEEMARRVGSFSCSSVSNMAQLHSCFCTQTAGKGD